MPPIRTKKKPARYATIQTRPARQNPSAVTGEPRARRSPVRQTQVESDSALEPAVAPSHPPPNVVNAFAVLKSVPKGLHTAHFTSNSEWDKDYQNALGSSTRKIYFGSSFVLTDQHIDQLLAIGPGVCRNLTSFEFLFEDVSYDAQNSAEDLTTGAVTRLAEACPSLVHVQLQGTSGIGSQALIALFKNCPNLSSLELSLHSRRGCIAPVGTALEALRVNPQWCPKLKKLRLPNDSNRGFMQTMRALSRERKNLQIQLTSVHEYKKWGDWELSVSHDTYRKGRIQTQEPCFYTM